MRLYPWLFALALMAGCSGEGEPDDDASSGSTATPVSDQDGDGWTVDAGDCNDTLPQTYPGALESCDGFDNNCDGQVDEGFPAYVWYPDADADGWAGDDTCTVENAVSSCFPPDGTALQCGDCDDTDPSIHPNGAGYPVSCDTDCDGQVDPDAPTMVWYEDVDADGYGWLHSTVEACLQPDGYVADGTDCNDQDADIYPGALEQCRTPADDNCNGQANEGCRDDYYGQCGGEVMATGTISGPVIIVGMPDERATPSNQTKTLPGGASTDATEGNLEIEVTADSGNFVDLSGVPSSVPSVSGTPSSSTFSLTLDVLQPGQPDRTASHTYTQSSITYGHTPFYVPTGSETIVGVTSGSGYQNPSIIALSNGTWVAAAERTLGTDGVVVYRKTFGSATWSAASGSPVWTTSTAFTSTVRGSPSLFTMPLSSGTANVIVGMLSLELTQTNTQTLRLDFSTDGGDVWSGSIYTNIVLDVSTNTYDIQDVVYDDVGLQLVVVLRKYTGAAYSLLTYISNDCGSFWTQLAAGDISDVRSAKMVTQDGKDTLVIIDGSNDMDAYARSAADSTWTLLAGDIAPSQAPHTDHLGVALLPGGAIYAYSRLNSASSGIQYVASSNGGSSWGRVEQSPGNVQTVPDYPYDSATAGGALADRIAAAALANGLNIKDAFYCGGQIYLVGDMTSAGSVDLSLMVLKFGAISSTVQWNDNILYGGSYYPANIISTKNVEYAFTGASTEALALDASGQLVDRIQNNNFTGYNSHVYGDDVNGQHWIIGASSSGGSTSTSAFVLRIAATDGAANYCQAEIRIDATNRQLRLYDVVGAASLGAAVSYGSGAPVELYIEINYNTLLASAWYKLTTSAAWTAISTNQTVTSAVGTIPATVNGADMGKLTATTAQVDTVFFRRIGPEGLADGSRTTLGIPSYTRADRIPADVHVTWKGSPLQSGDSWTAAARSSTPLTFTSPFSAVPSPTRQWVSATETAGVTKFFVYDFGSSYRGKLSRNLSYVSAANAGPFEYVRLYYWDGAAYQTTVLLSMKVTAFTGGSTGFTRDNAASYTFRPNASNANPQYWAPDSLKGYWAVFNDGGGDVIAGTILRNDKGYFTTATGALQANIELDPSTVVVVSGTFAGISTTTTGTLDIYGTDGMAVGVQAAESVRYYAVECDLAPGATVMRAGLLTFGAAHVFAHPPRDGSSCRWLAPDELRSLPGSKLLQGRRVGRKQQRAVEIPYDQVLIQNGHYNLTGASAQNGLSFDGSTVRAVIETDLLDLVSLHARAGQRYPVACVIDGDWQADPGSATQSFTGETIIHGYMAASVDVTAGFGRLRPPDGTDGSEHGSSMLIIEIV